jgi:hypothetical protein
MKRSAVAVLLGITLLGGALAGCGSGADRQPVASAPAPPGTTGGTDADAPSGSATAASCDRQPAPHPELARQLPAGFPTVTGWQPTEVVDQGRTRVVRGVLPGEPADLAAVRDRAADRLAGAGYRRTGSDSEAGFEAEAELEGPHEVNVNVRPLCRGYLVLSYLVRQ